MDVTKLTWISVIPTEAVIASPAFPRLKHAGTSFAAGRGNPADDDRLLAGMAAWICLFLFVLILFSFKNAFAQEIALDGFGQVIQIDTRFHSFVGKPSWLVIIRDVDHDQNVPHLFNIRRGENHWMIFTYSRNYLITVSDMKISTYQSRYNDFVKYHISDFCHLESHGRIRRGESIYVTVEGDLTGNPESIRCHVISYHVPEGP